jgi:hypothetical protein
MGIEAFGVSIKFTEPGIHSRIEEALASRPQFRVLTRKSSTDYRIVEGEYADGMHYIDFQLYSEVASKQCTLAVRFSPCSYDGIGPIFIEIVKDMLVSFEGGAWLMTSAHKQKAYYLPGDQDWLIAALPDEIAAMRKYWQRSFGNKQGCVRAKDSFSFAGLKFE